MPMYTVAQGDCLSSIALHHGYADWRKIYNHADNADFRRLRPNPNCIYPGDSIYIPETDTRTESAPSAIGPSSRSIVRRLSSASE